MILFRRHVIYGPEAAIPPEFERGEIRDVEGSETLKAWHGFMPVEDVEGALIDALDVLRQLQKSRCLEEWDRYQIGDTCDHIERLIGQWRTLEALEAAARPRGVPS